MDDVALESAFAQVEERLSANEDQIIRLLDRLRMTGTLDQSFTFHWAQAMGDYTYEVRRYEQLKLRATLVAALDPSQHPHIHDLMDAIAGYLDEEEREDVATFITEGPLPKEGWGEH